MLTSSPIRALIRQSQRFSPQGQSQRKGAKCTSHQRVKRNPSTMIASQEQEELRSSSRRKVTRDALKKGYRHLRPRTILQFANFTLVVDPMDDILSE
jgi:hypothetical protein